MEECSFPKARPISCNVCPSFQRRHTSLFCSAESPNRLPCFINTTFETALYQMVLHRPSEPAALIRHLDKLQDFATTVPSEHCYFCHYHIPSYSLSMKELWICLRSARI